MNVTILLILAVAGVAFLLLVLWLLGSVLKKVPPNQALITYGRGGTSVVTSGASWVWPIIQRSATFSLELMAFDVAPQQELYSHQGVAANVEAVTQLKVKFNQESIITAAEQVLSKTWDERQALIQLAMEGHLRGRHGPVDHRAVGQEPEMVSEKMRQISSSDLAKMGLEMVSFTIKAVHDKNGFIHNMGRPAIERIQQADAMSEAAVATAEADQKRVEAEMLSMTKQAEFQRDLALKKAAYDAQVTHEQAKADKSYDVQANVMQQQVITEAVKVQELEKTAQVKVQAAEIQRRELELQATILKTVEYERKRIETFAEAERQRITLEARGHAEATRVAGEAGGRLEQSQGAS